MIGRTALRIVGPLVPSVLVVVAGWWLALEAFGISPLVGKRPPQVWEYLTASAEHREAVFGALGITIRDAAVGFASGLAAAVAVAVAFVLFRSVEQTFMPVAMLLRSVPLVVMTPLITLVFGRELLGVAVIGGIVVFFPALVNIAFGLRSASPQATDLVMAYGGTRLTVLRKVAVPTAMPAVFASARISVPASIIGALIAEWLATGQGVGAEILRAIGGFRYDEVWADIVVVTGVSILAYALVGVVESLVLARFAGS
ncbi:ABC transporter permease subunit [Actinomadura sp. ATCC 31491]|uniref:ABC transporter permease subunit n=1 Tax=Actinomadura luzonensis TaxID=2805427 RepID=A0ABT0FLC9_9ACTN|nr:ABC transporter permease subunit [Actinomadura luzonensis]MCK2212761.1 ABC transporter permease subunit [Actinomadura luzonensis]